MLRFDPIRTLRGTLAHAVVDGALWLTRGDTLFTSRDLGATLQPVARVWGGLRGALAGLRPLDRFAHRGPDLVLPTPGGGAVAFAAHAMLHRAPGAPRFAEVPGPVDFRPMRRGACVAADGRVYVGEYRDNGGEVPARPRDAVHIWAWDGRDWAVAWRFPAGAVRHVHAIVADRAAPGRFWVCTGDTDDESRIWQTDDAFGHLEPRVAAGQASRACDLGGGAGGLWWGVDSPLLPSAVVEEGPAGGAPLRRAELPAPAYFLAENDAGHRILTTSVERGPSVRTRRVGVWAAPPGGAWGRVLARTADPTPQVSLAHLPAGRLPGDSLVVSFRATLRSEGATVIGRLRPAG